MIKLHNISFSYGLGPVFDQVSFSVGNNAKVGIVGPNGAGKSTLFRLLTNEELPHAGKIEIAGKVRLVPQEVKYDTTMEQSKTIKEYLDPGNVKEAYELTGMLRGLEMEHINILDKPQKLSGGQKTKLALARALIAEPDILLLDEPTNFLDTAGKQWVMDFLSRYPKTLMLISHDLQLLDKYIDKVLALDTQYRKVEEYSGNYSKFVRLKAEKDALLKRKIINEQKHIKRMEKGLQKLYKHKSEKGVRQRVQLERRLDRLKESLPDLPQEIKRIKIHLPEPAPVGEIPLKTVAVTKSYINKNESHDDAISQSQNIFGGKNIILENVSFYLTRGERFALIGPNGAGKSTLIKILMGLTQPDSGEVIKDIHINVGYYSQEFETFDFEKNILETMQEQAIFDEGHIRGFLAKFFFQGKKVFQKVGSLSGGEKTRLAIAQLMLQNFNVLILDEPTTYLDVLSQRIILDALKEYKGTMLIVSHTEDFIKELTPHRALLLPENEIVFWDDELLNRVSEI